MRRLTLTLLSALLLASHAAAQGEGKKPPTVRQATEGLTKIEGFVPLYWDAERGRMLLEVTRWDAEFLYQVSLPTGVGSNPIGLDRGQLGDTQVVSFERVGPKVLMRAAN